MDEKKVRQGKDAGQPIVKKKRSGARDLHVAGALRMAYEEAVREEIPSEFLDLLGKLD